MTYRKPVVGEALFEEVLEDFACVLVAREEDRADGVGLGEVEIEFVSEELVGRLEHDTRAVAGVLFGTRRSAVFEVREEFEAVGDDRVVTPAIEVHYDANTAVRALLRGVGERRRRRLLSGGVMSSHMSPDTVVANKRLSLKA